MFNSLIELPSSSAPTTMRPYPIRGEALELVEI
jgi:hypothetical protein